MDLSQLLSGDLGKTLISGISGHVGASEEETSSVVNQAAPALLGMLQRNAGSEEGANGIMNALNKHDGGILDNLSGFLGGGGNQADGDGILGHVLGDKRQTMENALSTQTGVASSKVSSIMSMLAPVVMGFLGRQSQSAGIANNSSGLGGLLGGLMGSHGGAGGGILSMLDKDGDGQLGIGDAISAFSGKGNSDGGGGIGDMLGNLLGK